MKYHTLFFYKIRKMLQKLSSAAVVIGAFRAKIGPFGYQMYNLGTWPICPNI